MSFINMPSKKKPTRSRVKKSQAKPRKNISRIALIVVTTLIAVTGIILLYNSLAVNRSIRCTTSGLSCNMFSSDRKIRVWDQATVYNLNTGQAMQSLAPLSEIKSAGLATRGIGRYWILANPNNDATPRGIFINTAFEITNANKTGAGRPIFNGVVMNQRNFMPLTNQVAVGGDCTAPRVWHTNLNNNLVAALQRAQLHLGREIPYNTAWRSFGEQSCLYNRGGSTPVAVPGTSNHERGLAVDINTDFAQSAGVNDVFRRYGLCRTVAGEPWHYELCN
ncbi:MAG: zinc D-Ala-D-Ala carboxypeptidase [Patescibacteria group bacterium]|jgi:hypothetical protein|nr:zinc D-Ala-D-Ala carboxypeptidase [Patescibacteria group bacterium]